jgi:hypothetical protein
LTEVDESAHTAKIDASGADRRGQGGASATIVSKLQPAPSGGTVVEVVTDYKITGRLARFGRGGMIEDISERLLRQFAANLQESLTDGDSAPAATADALDAFDVVAPVVTERIRANPALVAAAIVLLMLLVGRRQRRNRAA